MIKINGIKFEPSYFPDGTLKIEIDDYTYCYDFDKVCIDWLFDCNEELLQLMFIVKHFKDKKEFYKYNYIELYMPYVPNARMDRTCNDYEVFTLKYFADTINSLGFNRVKILDPHSNVATALFNNVRVIKPTHYINVAFDKCTELNNGIAPTLFFPDEGSCKRYSNNDILAPYAFGVKRRNWVTGIIESLDVIGDISNIKDKNILIVDDICSKGGTFYHSAKKLKELGAKNIYLYVTHCENTIFDGELLNSDLIERIFTTNSILTKTNEKIEVIKID